MASRPLGGRIAATVAGCTLVSFGAGAAPGVAAGPHVFTGRLEVRHSDDFVQRRSSTEYELLRRGRRIRLALARAPRVRSDTKVAVKARWVGGRLKGSLRPLRARARAATVAAGPRKVAVIL